MTAQQALEHMEKGGRFKVVNPEIHPINNRGYWKLFRNDTILKLIPDVPCAATVQKRFTIEEFLSLGKHDSFEPMDKL